jgi:FkbM family methyltransferase
MGEQLDRFYSAFMNPGLLTYIQKKDLDIQWIIEAGCHDGSDTLQFLTDRRFKRVFAFEPDPVAFEAATANLVNFFERVTLKNLVLMNKAGAVNVLPLNGEFGTGSTIFSQISESTNSLQRLGAEKVSRLDDEISTQHGRGALWLDVEGSAHLVLQGALRVLEQVEIAQIEIDMHAQSANRLRNYRAILQIMKDSGFKLIAAPLHPGYFGDALFVKKHNLNFIQKMKSLLLSVVFVGLHSAIYPLLGKPQSFS